MSAKYTARLHFETSKPGLTTKLTHGVITGPIAEAHRQISRTEEENIGTKAGHKAEETAEIMVRSGRSIRRSQKLKSRRKAIREVKRLEQSSLSDLKGTPEKNPMNTTTNLFSRRLQKQAIKKEYAAVRSGTSTKTTKSMIESVRKGGKKAAELVGKAITLIMRSPKVLLIVLGFFLIVAVMMYFLSSCSQMFLGSFNAVLSTSYTANDSEICAADLEFTRLEAELEYDISNTEREHPGYDQYKYSIGRIGHDPYMLLAYLTAKYESFTLEDIKPELDMIYSGMYTISLQPETEIRYRTETRTYSYTVTDPVTSESSIQIDTYDVDVPYDYYILNIHLNCSQMDSILYPCMNEEQREMYQIYMETRGNKACFGNPFLFNWQSQVTSQYGWRVHPISRNLQLHRGLDLAELPGTPIHSVLTGKVIQIGFDSDGFGNYVTVEDKDGYRSTYAHCASVGVREGQSVGRGDVIATVGNSGVSTGSHLHLELTYQGEYLNPYFFIECDDS